MERVDIIQGGVSWIDREDIDTDQIIPKQFLKRVEKNGFGEFLFYDWVQAGEIELDKNPILITGKNFGSGSSREHAVWALMDFGFRAIVAPSFSDIFTRNALENGLLLICLDQEVIDGLKGVDLIRIDLDEQTVVSEKGVEIFEIDDLSKTRLQQGLDSIEITLKDIKSITDFEEKRLTMIPKIK